MEEEQYDSSGGEYPGYIPQNIPNNQKRVYNDQLDFIQELLNKDDLKEKISAPLQLYFSAFVKNMAIANFTERDIQNMMLRFDDMKTSYLMRYPPGAYTWDLEFEFTALRNVLCAELTRGRDGFERKLMATSINQTYMQSDFRNSQPMGSSSGGIMGRFRKFFNRG
jgi:hypothetical protein